MNETVRLSVNALHRIRDAAARSPDKEICGLLVEARGEVDAHMTPNRHPDPEQGFAICDAAHARLQRQARRKGARIAGCFHSHPSGETEPSQTDLLAANEDGFVWVICAPDGRIQAWRATIKSGQKSFQPLELVVLQSPIAAGATAL